MKEQLISVIVPIYNVEKYLRRCVDSIINQTYKNLEIILVDDGSPDNCGKICDEYAEKDERVKVIHKQNGGLSDARNAGMEIATGEFVSFIDSDDWIKTEMMADMYRRAAKDSSDMVSVGAVWIDEEGNEIQIDTAGCDCVLDTDGAMLELIAEGKIKTYACGKLYKTSLINDMPFDKGKYHEDVFWMHKVIGKIKKASIEKNTYYYYLQRNGSIMDEKYTVKRLDGLDALKDRSEYVFSEFPDLYNRALYVYVGSCMYHMQLALSDKADKAIIENIKGRINDNKKGNIFEALPLKQKMWLHMFIHMPVMTCRLRNILKIGM